MPREKDDGIPIRVHTRRPTGGGGIASGAATVGLMLTVAAWAGLLFWGVAVHDFALSGRVAESDVKKISTGAGIAAMAGGGGMLAALVVGTIGWAALGAKPGVAWFRVACVSGLLACFLAVPVSCVAWGAGNTAPLGPAR